MDPAYRTEALFAKEARPCESAAEMNAQSSSSAEKPKRSPLVVIFLTVFIDLVGFGIIIPTSPFIAREFGASATELGLLMSIYSFFQFLFSPFWGSISDRIGRRPTILISLLGCAASYLLFAFSQSLTLLFVARGLAGLFGGNISTAHAYIGDVTPPHERSKGMGMIGAAFGLGFIFGPILGYVLGVVGQKLGSAPPFGLSFSALGVALLCLINFTFAWFFLKESLPPEKRGRAHDRPKRLRAIFQQLRRPIAGPLMFVYFFSGLAMSQMEPMLVPYIQDELDLGLKTATYGFAYIGVIMVITQGYLIRKWMPRLGEPKILVGGLLLFAVGLFLIAASKTLFILGIAMTLFAFGNGLLRPPNLGIISLSTPPEEQGVSMGVTNSLASLGRIIGPALGGFLYERMSHEAPFLAAGFVSVIGLAIVLLCYRRLPSTGLHVPAGQQVEEKVHERA